MSTTGQFREEPLLYKEPFSQFKIWFEEACSRKEILKPNVMCLTTATKDGQPSARFVSCKGYGKDGFKFFTNYESKKAKEMTENPNVAATFYWEKICKSVTSEGYIEKLSEEESNKYFYTRPLINQISACTSFQSNIIESRDMLRERVNTFYVKYKELGKVPKPTFWGGYVIRPTVIKFCQKYDNYFYHNTIFKRHDQKGELLDGHILHEGADGWIYQKYITQIL